MFSRMKNYEIALSILSVLMTIAPSITSAEQKKERNKRKIAEDVIVIRNPKKPLYKEDVFHKIEDMSIGESQGRDEPIFSQIGDMAVDEHERIFVSDWKETRIRVFDRNGIILMNIGKKGQGPGEFERINGIQITPQNELMVLDASRKRLSFFSLAGEFVRSKSLSEIQALAIRINSKRNFLCLSALLDPRSALSTSELRIYDPELKSLVTVASSDPQDVYTPFLPFLVWELDKNGQVFCGFNQKYEFSVYDAEGNVLRSISRDFDPVRIPEEERKAALKRLKQPENKNVPSFYPAYRRISVDEAGRVFVQTWERPEKGSGYYHDVFDSSGRYITRILFEFPPRVWKKGKLYTVEEDENGFQFVRCYKVEWKTEK